MNDVNPIESLREAVIHCPSADALRYPLRMKFWVRGLPFATSAPSRDLHDLSRGVPTKLVVLGPGASLRNPNSISADVGVVDFAELTGRSRDNPKRRTLDESWFVLARSATTAALKAMAATLPPSASDLIRLHEKALTLRLKSDIALRLRRLELVQDAIKLYPGHVLLIEGDQPMEDIEAAILDRGGSVTRVFAPTSRQARRRQIARQNPEMIADVNADPLWRIAERWRPRIRSLRNQIVLVADLRNPDDFRHSGTARALMEEIASRPRGGVTLIQPFSRLTRNALRASGVALGRGSRIQLVRQPQLEGLVPELAPLRTGLLEAVDIALEAGLPAGARTAILEATGGFIVSCLGPAIGLVKAVEATVRRTKPVAVVAVPVGSPFGALVVSAARACGSPTVEVQTLMIGVSERDPEPAAEKLAVLDTEQQAIFARRFGLDESRFILAGRVGQAPLTGTLDLGSNASKDVIFASQPLDFVCIRAVEILAEACECLGIALHVAPHPDEINADLDAYRAVFARWPGLRGGVLPRGAAVDEMSKHGVLATVVSNMALWAAAQRKDVIIVDVGVELPLDFASMGVALKVGSVMETINTLHDLAMKGPQSMALARSRAAYFQRNPQLREDNAARIIVDAALAKPSEAG